MIVIIDYGMGNLLSVRKAFEYLGEEVTVISDPQKMEEASRVVLPGVGAFPDAIMALGAKGWLEALQRQVVEAGKPFLGICLGMQLLADEGEENYPCKGLGWVRGKVKRFLFTDKEFKVPQVGWNEVRPTGNSPLFQGIREGDTFYFVHSYHMVCADEKDIAAKCHYGEDFVAAVQKDNVFATQFHPEKSQDNGLKILKNFIELRA